MYNKRSKSKSNPVVNVFLKTQILNILLFLIAYISASLIVYNSDALSSKYNFYIISAVTALSNFISGFYCGAKLKKNGMINALLFCLPLIIIILFISAAVNSFNIDLTFFLSSVIMITSSMLGGILSVNVKSIK